MTSKIIYKIFGVITNIVTWSVILCTLFLICTLFIPTLFGTEPYIVLSGSMEPVIHTGSLVYITEINEAPQENDIIAYDAGSGIPVVHRVISKGESGYITKGDANTTPDMSEVAPDKILGRMVLTVPNAGFILSAVRSHSFHIGSMSLPVAIPITVGVMMMLNIIQFGIGLFISNNKEN